jgi:hypothetical protein
MWICFCDTLQLTFFVLIDHSVSVCFCNHLWTSRGQRLDIWVSFAIIFGYRHHSVGTRNTRMPRTSWGGETLLGFLGMVTLRSLFEVIVGVEQIVVREGLRRWGKSWSI